MRGGLALSGRSEGGDCSDAGTDVRVSGVTSFGRVLLGGLFDLEPPAEHRDKLARVGPSVVDQEILYGFRTASAHGRSPILERVMELRIDDHARAARFGFVVQSL